MTRMHFFALPSTTTTFPLPFLEIFCCDIGLIVKDSLLEFFLITIILFPSLEIFLC